jgi:hypothetical protein
MSSRVWDLRGWARRPGLVGLLAAAAALAACEGTVGGPGGATENNGAPSPAPTTVTVAGPDGGPPQTVTLGATVDRNLRRLSKREYNNVVHDLLRDNTLPANAFGTEEYLNGFDNGSDGLTVDQTSSVEDFYTAAEKLALSTVTTNLPAVIGTCDPTTQGEAACVTALLSTFAPKAYRRPLTAAESSQLQAIYATGAAANPTPLNLGGFKGGIQLMIEAILESPSFLYREELGATDPLLPPGVVRLTDYEVATELSFLLTGSTPDDELLAAAANGTLKNASDYAREAQRLLASPAARTGLASFLNQWMATDKVLSQVKDPGLYAPFNTAMVNSMGAELAQFYDQVLFSGTGSLRELFTSPQGFVDPNLAPVYASDPQAPAAGPAAPGSTGLLPVALDGQVRQGIFTRAGWLTAHSNRDNSGPVNRGVFLMQYVLCAQVPPVPANVPPLDSATVAVMNHQTTRQHFVQSHLAGNVGCVNCHTVIDGVGFGFEEFDAIGRYRSTENGQNVDDSGDVVPTLDPDIASGAQGFVFNGVGPGNVLNGAAELSQKLVSSPQVQSCFIKQAYRYAMGQGEATAPSATVTMDQVTNTANSLAVMQNKFTEDTPMINAILSLVSQPAFVLRRSL